MIWAGASICIAAQSGHVVNWNWNVVEPNADNQTGPSKAGRSLLQRETRPLHAVRPRLRTHPNWSFALVEPERR